MLGDLGSCHSGLMKDQQPDEPRCLNVGGQSMVDVEVQIGCRIGQIRQCGQAGTLGLIGQR